MNIRLLKENEIEVRVGTINEKGATLLLYKDARVDMNILDESGLKWKRSHELINGNLFCTISIWDEDIKEWISRQDVGVESNTEKEKGQASDAFKRAGFNFGIGRELYTAPFTWISSDKYSSYTNPKTSKPSTYDKFSVTKISYNDNKEISELEIVNTKTGAIVFTLNDKLAERPKATNIIRDRDAEIKEAEADILTRAKKKINEELEKHDYTRADQKKAFILMVLEKATIDTLDDADQVADALDNENEE
jgi:hypothetical protein